MGLTRRRKEGNRWKWVGKWHGYDCGNVIYGVRKGILMPRGAEVDAKNEGGMQCRVVGEERACTRRGMEPE